MIPFGHKTCLKIDLESIIESKILPMIDFEFSDRFRALGPSSKSFVWFDNCKDFDKSLTLDRPNSYRILPIKCASPKKGAPHS